MHTVLIVEDDDFIRQVTKTKLESERYKVVEATNRQTMLAQLEKHEMHIILLDIMLEKDNGIELIAEIKKFTDAPIIVVSSKDHLFDKVIALEMGADDYMCKPAEPKELLSRINANIRRYLGSGKAAAAPQETIKKIRFLSWTIDPVTFSVKNDAGKDAELTKDEFDLLVTLAKSPNVVFTRERLFEVLKADNYDSFDRAIDIQVARIRKKLGDNARDPFIIKTIRKVGYQFIAPAEKL